VIPKLCVLSKPKALKKLDTLGQRKDGTAAPWFSKEKLQAISSCAHFSAVVDKYSIFVVTGPIAHYVGTDLLLSYRFKYSQNSCLRIFQKKSYFTSVLDRGMFY
jgi:hypothetical protein